MTNHRTSHHLVTNTVTNPPAAAAQLVGGIVCKASIQRRRINPRDVSQRARMSCAAQVPASRTQVTPSLDVPAPCTAARLNSLVVRQALSAAICTAGCVVYNPKWIFDETLGETSVNIKSKREFSEHLRCMLKPITNHNDIFYNIIPSLLPACLPA